MQRGTYITQGVRPDRGMLPVQGDIQPKARGDQGQFPGCQSVANHGVRGQAPAQPQGCCLHKAGRGGQLVDGGGKRHIGDLTYKTPLQLVFAIKDNHGGLSQ